MNICIDTREKGRKLRANLYYNDKGHNAEVRMLDVGDYLFDDRVVFEYKEIGDFMSSIVDESLFNEAANQSLEYPFHYVVVVGDVRNYLNDNWYYVSNKWGNDYGKYLSSNLGRYYQININLKTPDTIQSNVHNASALYALIAGLQNLQDPEWSTKFNRIRKVNIEDWQNYVNDLESMNVKVVTKDGSSFTYNSFRIIEANKKE